MKTKTKIKLSEKKLKMHVKIILSALKAAMENCETYNEFKKNIDAILETEPE